MRPRLLLFGKRLSESSIRAGFPAKYGSILSAGGNEFPQRIYANIAIHGTPQEDATLLQSCVRYSAFKVGEVPSIPSELARARRESKSI